MGSNFSLCTHTYRKCFHPRACTGFRFCICLVRQQCRRVSLGGNTNLNTVPGGKLQSCACGIRSWIFKTRILGRVVFEMFFQSFGCGAPVMGVVVSIEFKLSEVGSLEVFLQQPVSGGAICTAGRNDRGEGLFQRPGSSVHANGWRSSGLTRRFRRVWDGSVAVARW